MIFQEQTSRAADVYEKLFGKISQYSKVSTRGVFSKKFKNLSMQRIFNSLVFDIH